MRAVGEGARAERTERTLNVAIPRFARTIIRRYAPYSPEDGQPRAPINARSQAARTP